MPAISDSIIKRPPSTVWSVIVDPASHPHWLSQEIITKYLGDGGLVAGAKFMRINTVTGIKITGKILAVKAACYLKVRVDFPQESFATTEYHLIELADGCALCIFCESYNTNDPRYVYPPEMLAEQWQGNLQKLKRFCEAT